MRRLLNIRRGEGTTVLVLLVFVFFIQSVLSTGKVLQLSVFLDAYGQESLALAFFLSAATVILVSAGYSTLTRLVRPTTLIPVMLTVLASGFVVWRLAFGSTGRDFPVHLIDAPTGIEDPYGPFVLYVWVEVASTIAVVQAWAYANDAFDPRQAKRLIPLVGLGASFSFLCNGLIVQPLVAHWIDANDLTWIVAGSLLMALLAFRIAKGRGIGVVPLPKGSASPTEGAKTRGFFSTLQQGLPQIARSPLLRLLVFVTVATIVSQGLLDYLFMNALRDRLSKNELAAFYAAFIGLLGAAQILLQLFVSGRLLVRFGSPIIVLLAPAAVLLGGVAFLILPLFWLLVALRFGDRLFKQAFYSPSLQSLYTPIPSEEKHQAMTLIKGVISPAAYGLLGLLMLLGGARLPPRALVAVLAGIALTTVGVLLVRSRSAYAAALKGIMHRRRVDFETVTRDCADSLDWETIAAVQHAVFVEQDEKRAVFGLRLVAESTAPQVRALINRACRRHPSAVVRQEASRLIAHRSWPGDTPRILQLLRSETEPSVVSQHLHTLATLRGEGATAALLSRLDDAQPEIRAAAAVSACSLGLAPGTWSTPLRELIAGDVAQRLALANALLRSGNAQLARHCAPLLKDEEREIRAVALRAAATMRSPILLSGVTSCFVTRGPRNEAAEALVALGWDALPAITDVLDDPQADLERRLCAIQTLGKVNSPQSGTLLVGLLASRSHAIRYGAGAALARLSRRTTAYPGPSRIQVLARILNEVRVGYLLRHLILGVQRLESPLDPPLLLREIELRLTACEDHIFTLLSLVDRHSTSALVLRNLRRGDATQRTHAFELLELSFSRYVAMVLVPFMQAQNRTADLHPVLGDAWHRLRRAKEDPLASLLAGRDRWLQRCAAHEFPERVAALDPELHAQTADAREAFEHVLLLRRLTPFAELSAAELHALYEEGRLIRIPSGDALLRVGDVCDALYVVLEGELSLQQHSQEQERRRVGDFIGETSLSEALHSAHDAVATGDVTCLRLQTRDVLERLPANHRLVKGLFRHFSQRLHETIPPQDRP